MQPVYPQMTLLPNQASLALQTPLAGLTFTSTVSSPRLLEMKLRSRFNYFDAWCAKDLATMFTSLVSTRD